MDPAGSNKIVGIKYMNDAISAAAIPSAPLRLRGGLIAGVERCTSNEDAVKVRQGAACSRP